MFRHGLSSSPLLALSAALLVTGCAGGGASPASTPDNSTLAVAQRGAVTLPRTIDGIVVPAGATLPIARLGSGAGWMEPATARTPKVYVADQGHSAIRWYKQKGTNQQPIGEITSGLNDVDGLFVDTNKNLYACNFNNGTVTVYKPGATSPTTTLTGAGSPKFAAVAANGDVYVANFNQGTNGTVLEYDKGQTTPTRTVMTFGAGTFPEGLAIDSSNNLYVAFNGSDGEVVEFAGGSGGGTNLGIHVSYVGGLTVDKKGSLYLADQVNHAVNVYPAGSNTPSLRITAVTSAYGVSLNAKNNQLYITGAFTPTVWRVALPAGTINDTITADLASAFGVATSPTGTK
jgi:hypothetical protein